MGVAQYQLHQDDTRLVARAQAGDQAAFRQLFEAYSPLVYRIAMRMVGDEGDAADLTQDIFVRAYEKLGSLHDGQAFHAWITRLAVNMAHDRARRRRPLTFSLDASPPGTDAGMEWQLPSTTDGAEEQLLTSELSEQLRKAVLSLSVDHRSVVVLHHLEGMPVEQIANTLAVPIGTIKSRLARARAELKKLLEGYLNR